MKELDKQRSRDAAIDLVVDGGMTGQVKGTGHLF
jgi:hypothetical protein